MVLNVVVVGSKSANCVIEGPCESADGEWRIDAVALVMLYTIIARPE